MALTPLLLVGEAFSNNNAPFSFFFLKRERGRKEGWGDHSSTQVDVEQKQLSGRAHRLVYFSGWDLLPEKKDAMKVEIQR